MENKTKIAQFNAKLKKWLLNVLIFTLFTIIIYLLFKFEVLELVQSENILGLHLNLTME